MPSSSQKELTFKPPPANGLASQSTQQTPPVCTWSAHTPQSGPAPSPFPRYSHTLTATATAAGELFLFGGYVNSCAAGDLYVFSTRDFSTSLLKTSGRAPTPRVSHRTALIGTTLLIYGGLTSSGCGDDSLYLLNLGTSDFLMSSPTPAKHTLFFAPVSQEWTRVVVYGPGPGIGRWYPTTIVVGSKLFVFGGTFGYFGDRAVNDMWTLNLNCRTFAYSTCYSDPFDPIFPQ